jgi:DNA repair protein RecO (recombination protein O)
MALIETEGLILKSYSLAEADKIVVLLTQNEGLVRGVAKGAKRLKSRYGGSLEPFSIVHITYFQKEERELVSINQIELIKSFFENAGDVNFLQKISYLTELIVNFAPPHDPNEKLYRMAKICIETAAQNTDKLESIALYFELWILRLGGYLPDWNCCDNCKISLEDDQNAGLQINFHLLCRRCQKSKSNWTISADERKIFIMAQRLNPADFIKFSVNQNLNIQNVSEILKRIISNILGKEIIGDKVLLANP